MKYTKDYLERKIVTCKELVATATSEAQRESYQGYLDFWISKLPKSKKLPKPVEIIIESAHAEIFELENAPKQAYYNRDGKKHKTKAFKEYLNQKTQ